MRKSDNNPAKSVESAQVVRFQVLCKTARAIAGALAANLFVSPEELQACWVWARSKTPKGYGGLQVRGKRWLAHRLSYLNFVGDIPPGMHVCHHCDNPSCVNPAHLFLGTNQDNVDDKFAKGRGKDSATHCMHGHAYTPENTYWHRGRHRYCRACQKIRYQKWLDKKAILLSLLLASLFWAQPNLFSGTERNMWNLASLCGQRSEKSSQLSLRFPEVSVFDPLQKQDVVLQSLTDDIGLPKAGCANSVLQIFNVADVEAHGADLGNPLHGPSILKADPSGLDKEQQSKVHATYNSNTNDIQGIAKNPDSGTVELSAVNCQDLGAPSTHPPSPESTPLGWLLGRAQGNLREIQRARRNESTDFIVERVLARLIELEAHWRREYQKSEAVDARIAWLTCKLASEGDPKPHFTATVQILHVTPDKVWRQIKTNRLAKLGRKEYSLWYDAAGNLRPDIPKKDSSNLSPVIEMPKKGKTA